MPASKTLSLQECIFSLVTSFFFVLLSWQAFYNWAIAISDRAKMRGRTKEAEEFWKQVFYLIFIVILGLLVFGVVFALSFKSTLLLFN